jgi:hypothetical protein
MDGDGKASLSETLKLLADAKGLRLFSTTNGLLSLKINSGTLRSDKDD